MLSWAAGGPAWGHTRNESYSHWQLQGRQLQGSVSIPLPLFSILKSFFLANGQDPYSALAEEASHTFNWTRNGRSCEMEQVPVVLKYSQAGRVEIHLQYTCEPSGDLILENRGFLNLTQRHAHIARFSETGNYWHEHIFSTSESTGQHWNVPLNKPPQTALETLGSWIPSGIEHIIGGLDHIAFLIALLLWLGSWKSLLALITGFSIGHSISLIASVMGNISPSGSVIDVLVSFTIIFAASEKIAHRYHYENRHKWLIGILLAGTAFIHWFLDISQPDFQLLIGLAIFLISYLQLCYWYPKRRGILFGLITIFFGLIHGFGFAGTLAGSVLPNQHKLLALLGFNIGVEIGQLLILLIVISIVFTARPFFTATGLRDTVNQIAASLLCGMGTYWCIIRLYG